MGEEAELSVDSFVDTVANTVGVLIILTIMSIAMSHETAGKADATLASLHRQLEDISTITETKLPEVVAKIAARKKELAGLPRDEEAIRQYERMIELHGEREIALASGRRESATLGVELDAMVAGRRSSEEAIEAADEDMRKATTDFNAVELSELGRRTASELEGDVDALEGERQTLEGQALADAAEAKKLAEQAGTLDAERQELSRKVEALRKSTRVDVTVSNPLAPPDRKKRPILFECFVSSGPAGPAGAKPPTGGKGTPSVRLVSVPQNYVTVRKGRRRVLRPKPGAVGEAADALARPDSAFARDLAGRDSKRFYLYFAVRPDAYEAFCRASEVAVKAGWEVRWHPAGPGQELDLGGPGR